MGGGAWLEGLSVNPVVIISLFIRRHHHQHHQHQVVSLSFIIASLMRGLTPLTTGRGGGW
jgi:hypothetical protein